MSKVYQPGPQAREPKFNLYTNGRMYINPLARGLMDLPARGYVRVVIENEDRPTISLTALGDKAQEPALRLGQNGMLCVSGVLKAVGCNVPEETVSLDYEVAAESKKVILNLEPLEKVG